MTTLGHHVAQRFMDAYRNLPLAHLDPTEEATEAFETAVNDLPVMSVPMTDLTSFQVLCTEEGGIQVILVQSEKHYHYNFSPTGNFCMNEIHCC